MCQWCVSVKAGSGRTGEIPILVLEFMFHVLWCVSVKAGSGSTGEIPFLFLIGELAYYDSRCMI